MKRNHHPEKMNAIANSYGLTMRWLLLSILCLLAILIMMSCSALKIPVSLPFDVGIRYQIEPGLFIVATPKDKGGLDVKFEGQGNIGNRLSFDGTAWTYTSERTGIVYRISEGENRRPKIEIVDGGSGKLRLVPAAEAGKPAE